MFIFAIGRKKLSITYEYLHINDSPAAVKEERESDGGDGQMKMKCHERKVQARWGEIELFYLLVRNRQAGWT